MKSSKVILLCVTLFCSKFVESIPFDEERGRQGVYQPSNWPVNRNAPGQYQGNGFAQTQNGNTLPNPAFRNDNNQEYFKNQGSHNYGYNNNPTQLPPVKERLVDFDSLAEKHNQRYRNLNWQSQNPYGSAAASGVGINDHERSLLTSDQENLRGSVQYQPTKYIPTSNQQFYEAERTYPARDQYQYPLMDNSEKNRYTANAASRPESSGFTPFENYSESHGTATDINARHSGGKRYVESSGPLPVSNYNGVPAVIPDALTEKTGKNTYAENYGSSYGSNNNAPINNFSDGSPFITDAFSENSGNIKSVNSYGSRPGAINPATMYNNNEGTSVISDNLAEKNDYSRFLNNYWSRFGSSNTAPVNKYNDEFSAPTDTLTDKSGINKYGNVYVSDGEPSNQARVNNKNDAPVVITDTLSKKYENNKYANRFGSITGSNNQAPVNYKNDVPAVISDTFSDKIEINKYVDRFGGPSNQTPNNNKNNVPVVVSDTFSGKSDKSKYENNYSSNSGTSNTPTNNSNNGTLAVISDTEKFGKDKYASNKGSDFGPNNPDPANITRTPSSPTDSVVHNPGNNKHGNNYGSPSSSAPIGDINKDQKVYRQMPSGIHTYDYKNIVSNALVKKLIAENKSRFLIIHPDGRVENVDKLDPIMQKNPNYRLIQTNGKNSDEAKEKNTGDNGIYSTQSPAYVPNNMLTPSNGQTLPPNTDPTVNNNNKKPTTQPVPSKADNKQFSTTLSPITSDYNRSSTPLVSDTPDNNQSRVQSTTNSPTVVTTPCPYNTTDGIITISPIESVTDNVSDVPPMTTTTTASPVTTPSTLDTVTNVYRKKDDARKDLTSYTTSTDSSISDKANKYSTTTVSPGSSVSSTDNRSSISDKAYKYSTTTVSPSSSVSPTDNSSGDEITIEIISNQNNTQSNEQTVVIQANSGKNNQTATYNSLSNTDVPAKRDDYSSVTTEPSVQNDGNTSTTPGDNLLESKQSMTDLKISVSTSNDTEADIITISIEVSESTDDGDSSSDETLVVTIDTKKASDDDSKTSTKSDCEKNHTNERGKNIEMDLSHFDGEPMMVVKTTNQDLIDKLTASNDTTIIYLFQMKDQPIVEKEKQTTIHCNGTVVIDFTETTWKFKDDPLPTVKKTTQTILFED